MAEDTIDESNPWNRLTGQFTALQSSLSEFLSSPVDRVNMVREGIRQGEFPTVLYVARYMRESELMQLFPKWVEMVSYDHRHIASAREIVHSLPRDWVVANIERVAELLLEKGTEDEYWRLLEMYIELDKDLTIRLAQRAMQHSDWEIREAGEYFLQKLQQM